MGELNVDRYLRGFSRNDGIAILEVFAVRFRAEGRLGRPVSAPAVRDALLQVSKGFTRLGAADPRHTRSGTIDPRISDLVKSYGNKDRAPERVLPVPIQLLHAVGRLIDAEPTAENVCAFRMASMAFFFMLRSGEYCRNKETNPLQLQDAMLARDAHSISPAVALRSSFASATNSTLTFPDQKNRERGETVGHGVTGDARMCPTKIIAATAAILPYAPIAAKPPAVGTRLHRPPSRRSCDEQRTVNPSSASTPPK